MLEQLYKNNASIKQQRTDSSTRVRHVAGETFANAQDSVDMCPRIKMHRKMQYMRHCKLAIVISTRLECKNWSIFLMHLLIA